MPPDPERVRIDTADGVASVRMTRGEKHNGLDWAMFEALNAALDELDGAEDLARRGPLRRGPELLRGAGRQELHVGRGWGPVRQDLGRGIGLAGQPRPARRVRLARARGARDRRPAGQLPRRRAPDRARRRHQGRGARDEDVGDGDPLRPDPGHEPHPDAPEARPRRRRARADLHRPRRRGRRGPGARPADPDRRRPDRGGERARGPDRGRAAEGDPLGEAPLEREPGTPATPRPSHSRRSCSARSSGRLLGRRLVGGPARFVGRDERDSQENIDRARLRDRSWRSPPPRFRRPRRPGRSGRSSATPAAAGPAQFNQVYVDKYGPANGKRVLVLMPGTSGGSGDFTLAARYLVKKVPGLQVWAIDRRSQALERPEVFAQALRGEVTLQQMFDHYLGWLTNGGTRPNHFKFLGRGRLPLRPPVGDGDRPERRAHRRPQARGRGKGRRSVVLGGHSLGASLTAAYASWDFNGTPGYKDIEGMVLIDGGLMGSFDAFTATEAQAALNSLESGSPFLDLLGLGIPEIAGIFGEIGGVFALRAPNESATTLQSFPLLPPAFNPPYPGHEPGAAGIRVRPGHLARQTSPCSTSTPGRSPRAGTRATGMTTASPRCSGWRRRSARSRPTRSSGTSRAGSRSTRTAPTSWSRTTSRTCSACGCSTSPRWTSRSTRSRPT